MKKLVIICGLLAGCARLRTVTAWDVAIETTAGVAMSIDASQTAAGLHRCIEINPVLAGPRGCGNGVPVAGYFAVVAAVHMVVALLLPPGRARAAWQAIVLGAEAHTVYRNHVRFEALRAGGGRGPQ